MVVMRWLKHRARRAVPAAGSAELGADLKAERFQRAVRDFPGRRDSDLARIIYGHDDAGLVAAEWRRLEVAGYVARDPETGGIYLNR
jgi:hypothetical protein